MQDSRKRLPWGTTLVFIFARPSDALVGMFATLKEKGHRLIALQIGEQKASGLNHDIAWYNVRSPGDLFIISPTGAK